MKSEAEVLEFIDTLVKTAEERAYNDFRIHLGNDRKVKAQQREKDGESRTYISIDCYTCSGNYKGRYHCGYVNNSTGEYVVTQYDKLNLLEGSK